MTVLTPVRMAKTLAAVAGLAHGTLAQTQTHQSTRQPRNNSAQSTPMTPVDAGKSHDYRSWKWLDNRNIVNTTGDEIGEVDDLLVDRGSGRVEYAVVKTGSTLGMGGNTLTVPFQELQWDSAKERLVLNSTVEQLRAYPKFSPDDWQNLRSSPEPASWRSDTDGTHRDSNTGLNSNWNTRSNTSSNTGSNTSSNTTSSTGYSNQNRNTTSTTGGTSTPGANTPPSTNRDGTHTRDGMARQDNGFQDWMWGRTDWRGSDSYGTPWDTSQSQRIEGHVVSLSRERVPHHGEHVVAEISTTDGATKKIALGPAWFINGSDVSINRGDRITVNVVPISVATSAQINGKSLELRDGKGSSTWSQGTFRSGSESYSAPYYRNVMLSKIVGADLDCRGTDCGEIEDAVIDCDSGTVAFLSIDPDQNFLGIADTKRLVPWTVAAISVDGTVRLDASKDMVLKSLKTPSDMTTLNTDGQADTVYDAYGVPIPQFDRGFDEDRRSSGQYQHDNNRTSEPSQTPRDDRKPR